MASQHNSGQAEKEIRRALVNYSVIITPLKILKDCLRRLRSSEMRLSGHGLSSYGTSRRLLTSRVARLISSLRFGELAFTVRVFYITHSKRTTSPSKTFWLLQYFSRWGGRKKTPWGSRPISPLKILETSMKSDLRRRRYVFCVVMIYYHRCCDLCVNCYTHSSAQVFV